MMQFGQRFQKILKHKKMYHQLSIKYSISNLSWNNKYINRFNGFEYISIRYRRGGATKERRKQELSESKPEKGYTLDSENVRKNMQKYISKYQEKIIEIQPKTFDMTSIESLTIQTSQNKKEKLSKIADIKIRNTQSCIILAHESINNEYILKALQIYNPEFGAHLESSGLITINIPQPKKDEIDKLKGAVKVRHDDCIINVKRAHTVGQNDLKKIQEFIMKDEGNAYLAELNRLVKEQIEVVNRITQRKLAEFE